MRDERFERLWSLFEDRAAARSIALTAQARRWLQEWLAESLRQPVEGARSGGLEAGLARVFGALVDLLADAPEIAGPVGLALLRAALAQLGWGRSDDFPVVAEAAGEGRGRGTTKGTVERAEPGADRPWEDRDWMRAEDVGSSEKVGYDASDSPPPGGRAIRPAPSRDRPEASPEFGMRESEGPGEPIDSEPRQPSAPMGAGPRAPAPDSKSESEPDPPRAAYARLDAPEVAIAGKELEVAVGLAEKPSPGVVGGPMERPPASVGPYKLTVQLVAEGCRLREGETWRRELPVTAAKPYPAELFHLVPEAQAEPLRARTIQAFYSVEGQTTGMALRPLAVARDEAHAAAAPPQPPEPGLDMSLPTKETAPDLEVRILLDQDHPGRLLWTFQTPYAGIDLPDPRLQTDIGDQPREFARQLVDKVNKREGQVGIFPFLSGVGRTVADKLPQEEGFDFWNLLRAVAAKKAKDEGPPNVLILSQEPYVPWELAEFPAPLLDAAAPPFLAAQANVGRWVLARSRPKQPPPTAVEVHSAAVVSGVYNRPGWRRLPEAEAEAEALASDLDAAGQPLARLLKLKAAKVNAATQEVLDLLGGPAGPRADLLHFAVHGIYDPNGMEEGLMLVDGQALDPMEVKGQDLPNGPFVFLNACQVGSASKILGDYAGMAEAFLAAGAAGVVAPLWSVKDALARKIALDFYAAVQDGACPAAALREARKSFQAAAKPQSATYLAYQFFGHPALKLNFSIP